MHSETIIKCTIPSALSISDGACCDCFWLHFYFFQFKIGTKRHHQIPITNNHKMHHPNHTQNMRNLSKVVTVASTIRTYAYIYFNAFHPARLQPLCVLHSAYCPSTCLLSSNTQAHPNSHRARFTLSQTHAAHALNSTHPLTSLVHWTTVLRTSASAPTFVSVRLRPAPHKTGNARFRLSANLGIPTNCNIFFELSAVSIGCHSHQ